jgi:hypothetical protein
MLEKLVFRPLKRLAQLLIFLGHKRCRSIVSLAFAFATVVSSDTFALGPALSTFELQLLLYQLCNLLLSTEHCT